MQAGHGIAILWVFGTFRMGRRLSANDSTAKLGNNGTIGGATATNGQIDGGASFNGSTAYIDVPNSTSLNSTTATWSAWFKTTQSASNYPFILGRASTSGSKNGISLFVDTSGHARVQVYGSSSPVVDVTSSGAAVNDGNWHYLTFTINSSTSLYLDGSSQVVTATPSGSWSFNSQDARFGISLDSFWGKWAGSEDEGRVSNAVRSADWIQTSTTIRAVLRFLHGVGAAVTGGGSSSPVITSLSPTSGAVGSPVTITGSNFGSSQGTGSVTFNGTPASVSSWSNTSISTAVPSGATAGNVVVNVNSTISNSMAFTVVPTPSITSLSPTSGSVGTPVTINGSNFGSSQGTGSDV